MPLRKLPVAFAALTALCLTLSSHPLLAGATLPIIYFSNSLVSKRHKKQTERTRMRIRQFIHQAVDNPLNPPSVQNRLQTTIGVQPTYHRESSLPEPHTANMEHELTILEREMNLIHDKLALSLLATIGIPLIYFVQSLAINDAFALLPLSVATLFLLQRLFQPAYDPTGISALLQQLKREPPTDHRSLLNYDALIAPWRLESAVHLVPKKHLTIPQEIVATLIASTWQMDPTQRETLVAQFIDEFAPMRHFENSYAASLKANQIKRTFNLFATSTVLGILVAISRLLVQFGGLLALQFPQFLHITTGLLLGVGHQKGHAAIALLLYLAVVLGFALTPMG